MSLFSKEHYELIVEFEKTFKSERLDKEEKALWTKGVIYQDGNVNKLFLAYRVGYSLGKVA